MTRRKGPASQSATGDYFGGDRTSAGNPGASGSNAAIPPSDGAAPLPYQGAAPLPWWHNLYDYGAAPALHAPPLQGAVPAAGYPYQIEPESVEQYWLNYALHQSANEYARQQAAQQQVASSSGPPSGPRYSLPGNRVIGDVSKKGQAEALSYKYWSTGSLGYTDLVIDGFYCLHGDFPEVSDKDKFPKLEDLKGVRTVEGDPREVVCVDHDQDSSLCSLRDRAAEAIEEVGASQGSTAAKVEALAKVVADYFGGSFDCEDALTQLWMAASAAEKKVRRSV